MKKILSPFILIVFAKSTPILSRYFTPFLGSSLRFKRNNSTRQNDLFGQSNYSAFSRSKTLNPILITDRSNSTAGLIKF